MSSKRITAFVGLSLFAAFIGYDVIVAMNSEPGDTYSELVRALWWQAPIIGVLVVCAMGVVAGHWFKPRKGRLAATLALALGLGLVFAVAFIAGGLWW